MDRVLDILRKKNHFLEKFLLISEAELINFESGDYDNIEEFYQCREKILNIINQIEVKFEDTFKEFADVSQLSAFERTQVDTILKRKKELVGRILDLDLKLLACVDTAKSDIIRELRDLKEGKKVLEGYRAPTPDRHLLNEEI